jgi:hypothetical protein
MVLIEVSIGELLDKLTILAIKRERISDPQKLEHIEKEFSILQERSAEYLKNEEVSSIFEALKKVNSDLWVIEDDLRDMESQKRFDSEFVEKARAVYFTNDKRFELKNEINSLAGSAIREQKGYKKY